MRKEQYYTGEAMDFIRFVEWRFRMNQKAQEEDLKKRGFSYEGML